MSLDRSLRTQPAALNKHRNVLTRAERLSRLVFEARFEWGARSPLGLQKVANRKVAATKKPKKEEVEGAEGAVAAPAAEAKPKPKAKPKG